MKISPGFNIALSSSEVPLQVYDLLEAAGSDEKWWEVCLSMSVFVSMPMPMPMYVCIC